MINIGVGHALTVNQGWEGNDHVVTRALQIDSWGILLESEGELNAETMFISNANSSLLELGYKVCCMLEHEKYMQKYQVGELNGSGINKKH